MTALVCHVIAPGVTKHSRYVLICHVERHKAVVLDCWNI